MLKKKNKYSGIQGTSLIEFIIYTGILAVMTLFVVAGIIQISQAFVHVRNERKVALAAETALERMVREIRLGKTLTVLTSTSVDMTGFNHCTGLPPECTLGISQEKGKRIQFTSSKIQIDTDTSDAISPQDITPSDVTISTFSITQLASQGGAVGAQSRGLRIAFTASAGVGQTSASHRYYATAILRSSYQRATQ